MRLEVEEDPKAAEGSNIMLVVVVKLESKVVEGSNMVVVVKSEAKAAVAD